MKLSRVHPIGIGTWMIGGGWDYELSIAYADYDNEKIEIEARLKNSNGLEIPNDLSSDTSSC